MTHEEWQTLLYDLLSCLKVGVDRLPMSLRDRIFKALEGYHRERRA
jgi:hypothetical protein